ncbi:hypothetical protein IQ06DRAFT_299852 [Phaeosphaeriaceae sp. SRC1lsM3a]|nr:hypothetical protein IQ06DRAFT_299852 [Stagonospora sp. SRC1lsM3a]
MLNQANRCTSWTFDGVSVCIRIPICVHGSNKSCRLFNGHNSTCEATLSFANPLYLPVSWTVVPKNCAGDQVASLNVPTSSPNGSVLMTWQCTGYSTTSSTLLNITGGCGDVARFNAERRKSVPTVSCRNSSALLDSFLRTDPLNTIVPHPISTCT